MILNKLLGASLGMNMGSSSWVDTERQNCCIFCFIFFLKETTKLFPFPPFPLSWVFNLHFSDDGIVCEHFSMHIYHLCILFFEVPTYIICPTELSSSY